MCLILIPYRVESVPGPLDPDIYSKGEKAVVLHPHGGLQHNVKHISDNVASNKFVKQIYSSLSFS